MKHIKLTIEQLQHMRESEDHVEFKKGEHGNVSYNGANSSKPSDRRRCILGYVTALCNEGGGYLVIGMHDKYPHEVIGTSQAKDCIGQLVSNIYRDSGIRTYVYELYYHKDGKELRVLVIQVPSRPIGKLFKYEDVALMRVGEELKPMDDKTYISIIQEQEPDFSEQMCKGASFDDLDKEAIGILKTKYSQKQDNPHFLSLTDKQALSDLKLIDGDRITNAAVLLVGKEDIILKYYPQAKVFIEFRSTDAQIRFDNRLEFSGPFFKLINEVWNAVNSRNGYLPIREGAYIGLNKIPFFNEEVIRELINNAFAHRDYRRNSEIVIKMYPNRLEIINAGGFPQGVSIDNLLTVSSTPRNRLLADVLSKTGIVERSGQGIDKVFLYTLAEGKPKPDYSRSDDFSVVAILSTVVKEAGFALFVQTIQKELPLNEQLSVFEILELCKIRDGMREGIDKEIAQRLLDKGFIEKHGRTNAQFFTLHRTYYEMTGKTAEYSMMTDWNPKQLLAILVPHLEKYKKAKRADILKIIGDHVSDKQLRTFLDKLVADGMLKAEGNTNARVYMLGETYLQNSAIINEAIGRGLKQMMDEGKI